MRKMLFAAMLALLLLFEGWDARAATTPQDPPKIHQNIQALSPWNRFAKIKDLEGKVVKDLGPHTQNPFKDKEACAEGLEHDTKAILTWLMLQGVDIMKVDVAVTCEPAEGTGI